MPAFLPTAHDVARGTLNALRELRRRFPEATTRADLDASMGWPEPDDDAPGLFNAVAPYAESRADRLRDLEHELRAEVRRLGR